MLWTKAIALYLFVGVLEDVKGMRHLFLDSTTVKAKLSRYNHREMWRTTTQTRSLQDVVYSRSTARTDCAPRTKRGGVRLSRTALAHLSKPSSFRGLPGPYCWLAFINEKPNDEGNVVLKLRVSLQFRGLHNSGGEAGFCWKWWASKMHTELSRDDHLTFSFRVAAYGSELRPARMFW